MLNNPSDVMNMNQFNLEIADMFYFGGTIEPHYRGQVVCAHACGIKHTLFDDIINMSVASGMEMDNFYAKIIQHMSYNYNPRGQYNVVMLQPFNTRATYMNSMNATNQQQLSGAGLLTGSTSYTAFTLTPNSGTITGGTIRIYGYNNG
jgi:hypothetical protein